MVVYQPVIPAFGQWRQEDQELHLYTKLENSVGYMRPCQNIFLKNAKGCLNAPCRRLSGALSRGENVLCGLVPVHGSSWTTCSCPPHSPPFACTMPVRFCGAELDLDGTSPETCLFWVSLTILPQYTVTASVCDPRVL